MEPQKVLLTHRLALGDVVVMTGLVRDLALAHPGRYLVAVDTSCRGVWDHNPHVVPRPRDAREMKSWSSHRMDYGGGLRSAAKDKRHFLAAFHADFEKSFAARVPVTLPRPDLHLGPGEGPLLAGRYWVVFSGGKTDFTTKLPALAHVQAAVDAMTAMGLTVVQAGGRDRNHLNPALRGVVNMVGATDLRALFRLIAHADGVLCTITSAAHIAAAFERPCVVWAGGREEHTWEGYTNDGQWPSGCAPVRVPHRFLHTIGLLDCCKDRGCWKNKVSPDARDKSVCKRPVAVAGQIVPLCQKMVTPERVVESVLSYYLDGTLSPPSREIEAMARTVNDPVDFRLPDGRSARVSVTLPTLDDTQLPLSPPPLPPPLPPRPTVPPLTIQPLLREGPPAAASALDDPLVGGRLTAFVLCYGDYAGMHRRCVGALAVAPPGRLELRVIGNAVCEETRSYLLGLERSGRVSKFYDHRENLKKYPAMRAAFRDPELPVETEWVVWLDDDTMADVDPLWLEKLAAELGAGRRADPRLGMVGAKYLHPVRPALASWMRAAPWWRGRPLRDKSGRDSPNGDFVHFITGSFWAMRSACLSACDVPDARLGHNGGDVQIGEQLHQGGYTIRNWAANGKRLVVHWSSVPRRGLSEKHPGT